MTTIPALVGIDGCPFDWDGDAVPSGLHPSGRIFKVRSATYAYGNFDELGLLHGLVLARAHIENPEQYFTGEVWEQIGQILLRILVECMQKEWGVNFSINGGYKAGQRFADLHTHILPRRGGTPDANMGFGLLTKRFNGLISAIHAIAEVAPTDVRDSLLAAIAEATE